MLNVRQADGPRWMLDNTEFWQTAKSSEILSFDQNIFIFLIITYIDTSALREVLFIKQSEIYFLNVLKLSVKITYYK